MPQTLLGAETERILSFHSDVTVYKNAVMSVRETITVRSAGREIKRGIYRDFPTRYRDRHGNRYNVGFDVAEVLRDGEPEGFHTENRSNGVRVYIGKRDVLLPPGTYTYTLTYTTDRQIGFFEDHDELYWNVTGNGWIFPIEKATAAVTLPSGIRPSSLRLDGYTGPEGAAYKDFTGFVEDSGKISFSTTKPLGPKEGLTVVAGWPKGFVREPTPTAKFGHFLRDNRSAGVGFLGILLLAAYYAIVWAIAGRDPARGTVIPLYRPPRGLSPASTRYITRMGFDRKCFTAAVLDMAVRGFLSIREEDGAYTLVRKRTDKKELPREEKKIYAKLLRSRTEIKLKKKNHARIAKALEGVKNALKVSYEKKYFLTNTRYFVPGLILSILVMILIGLSETVRSGPPVIFICFWLTIWSLGVIALLGQVITHWKSVLFGGDNRLVAAGAALFFSLFSVPFVIGEIAGLYLLYRFTSTATIALLAATVLTNILFHYLLKAPTRLGRRVMDEIEGFKMYLSIAEKDRLGVLQPVERTPEHYERYLPYALALDVEQAWSEKFSDVLERAGEGGAEYSPRWYTGPSWNRVGSSRFGSSLGSSLSGAIASSAVAPGSRSGFSGGGGGFSGGGGSSGGGGGGGGGGGW